MKSLYSLSLVIFSALLARAQVIPPKTYPPNGTYFIYNVQYRRVFDDFLWLSTEDNPIIGWIAHPHTQSPLNQQWVVEPVGNSSDQVTMRVIQTIENDPPAGGYAVNALIYLISTLRIIDGNNAITLINGTTDDDSQGQLTVETIDTNVTNQRWSFVPDDQIDKFLDENGTS
ncbi:uncharacterized protein FOMMEDRAFT_30707 [Fomitiporia mediterranea MF3/22]|uniref:uncharacterized protein n=1 Tax=Fomitiporia mediterranea (strain MF3/22) TaxID=694068 RepID=UPI00044095C6|nr:uncharacterized protein FOMMEDRAFT_30707 [Fomitiporia mediterranea MF3/22]EJD00006.1 hypothetical protein FOMMEDRAFT_30707 [Fomitiporia mediterranea MF3/22]